MDIQVSTGTFIANGFIVHNCGDAGGMLHRVFTMLGWDRNSLRIDNTLRCRPPNDWLEGAPWQYHAIQHCSQYLEDSLNSPSLRVVVPMGGVALRRVLHLSAKKVGPQNFHGTVTVEPHGRFYVVPTYHPSFLQRGAHNLIGTVLWDLQRAKQVSEQGWKPDPASLVVDPPIEWFAEWVRTVRTAIQQDPAAYPLSVDIETPDKAHGRDEGEISPEDRSFIITRVNLACHPDEGITVPFQGPYVDLLTQLLTPPAALYLWNKEYDLPRLEAAGVIDDTAQARGLDLMWLWHLLQSDLPRGLGFVAPFYSTFGAWKHLADSDPAQYGAIDGLQTHRVGFGVIGDLIRLGLWEVAQRHVHQLHHQVLRPAQLVGVKIDRERLTLFKTDLTGKATRLLDRLQTNFPDGLRNLTPKLGLTKRPADNVLHAKASAFTRAGKKRKGKEVSELKLDLYKRSTVVERQVERMLPICALCHQAVANKRGHKCPQTGMREQVLLTQQFVTRYFWAEPFNPDSWQQVLAYIKSQGHEPGKAKKTRKDTTNRETLTKLQKTGDPFYQVLLDYRAVQKVKGTYVDGTERRLDDADRVHSEPTFKPSTMRLSYVNPNITNVIQDRGGQESLAAGFRACVVSRTDCRLLEVDFAGSEAVDVGWVSRDPGYIRLAKLGVHAGLASHILGKPYDPSWSEADLGAYFKAIKHAKDPAIALVYDRSKRFVHGFSYGLTLPGMVLQFPEMFPTRKVAEQYADIFTTMAPAIPAWQQQVRERAHRQHYLGGPGDHPFGYKHWFWSVFAFKKITSQQYARILHHGRQKGIQESTLPVTIINGQYFKISLGEDGKRAVAFFPQSITAGKLKEVMLRLFTPGLPSYIGEAYFGRTPLRAPIHDSLLLELPVRQFDYYASLVVQEMQRPFTQLPCPLEWGLGPYLSTGVSAKVGSDWQHMEPLSLSELGVGTDTIFTAALEEEEEEVSDLGREVA